MSVGKDDGAITDAFITLAVGGTPEAQIPAGQTYYVVVEAETGTNAILSAEQYQLEVLLQDVTNFVNVLTPPAIVTAPLYNPPPPAPAPFVGPLPTWNTPNVDVSFVIKVPTPSGPAGTLYKIRAVLSLGAAQTDVYHFESELVLVTK